MGSPFKWPSPGQVISRKFLGADVALAELLSIAFTPLTIAGGPAM
jgi:hypothetical protein